MKIIGYYIVALFGFITLPALSATLLIKSEVPAPLPPQYALPSTSCIFDDQGLLLTTHRLNGLFAKKSDIVSVSTDAVKKMIAEAATGSIKKPSAVIIGAATVSYYAYQKLTDGSLKRIFLAETHGNSIDDTQTVNESAAAVALKNLIDVMCQ